MQDGIRICPFDELTTRELYEILRVRAAVFVVEQNCVYQDLDGEDYKAQHVILYENGILEAYLRMYPAEGASIKIGRVLTMTRGKGYGKQTLRAALRWLGENAGDQEVFLEAQVYAIGFYEAEGFAIASEEFLEDGIPHVKMILKKKGK